MNLTDIIALSLRNLRQAKLRTALTVLGVVIGVAAIITMVSFGIGLQQNIIANAFAKLDLFTVVQVVGPSADELLSLGGGNPDTSAEMSRRDAPPAPTPSPETTGSDSGDQDSKSPRDRRKRVLDDPAIAEMQKIVGVRYAIPVLMFQSYVRFGERTARLRIGGALASTEFNPRFRTFLAGQAFSSDSATEVVVTEGFLNRFAGGDRRRRGGPFGPAAPDKSEAERTADAQAAIGKQVELLTLPSGQAQASVFGIPLSMISEDEESEGRFVKSQFRIVGVLATETGVNFDQFARTEIYVPVDQARAFRDANRDPLERMGEALVGDTGYSRAEVRVMDPSRVRDVQQQITKLGFNSFSLTNQIDEIRYVPGTPSGNVLTLVKRKAAT